jgi:hypothetical protein
MMISYDHVTYPWRNHHIMDSSSPQQPQGFYLINNDLEIENKCWIMWERIEILHCQNKLRNFHE